MIDWLQILFNISGTTTILLCVIYIIRAGWPKDWSKDKPQNIQEKNVSHD